VPVSVVKLELVEAAGLSLPHVAYPAGARKGQAHRDPHAGHGFAGRALAHVYGPMSHLPTTPPLVHTSFRCGGSPSCIDRLPGLSPELRFLTAFCVTCTTEARDQNGQLHSC
jgi:hypothetical protein